MSFEEYINTMGPIWELQNEYRSLDDNIRDAGIGALILASMFAPAVLVNKIE